MGQKYFIKGGAMKINADIDIDFGNRNAALAVLRHTKASIIKGSKLIGHNSGVYFTKIPETVDNRSTLDYKIAEERGYFKLDLLNVHLYEQVKSEEHLTKLLTTTPDWSMLTDRDRCRKLIHVGNHYGIITQMPEPVDSIPRLAMLLAVIRPGKKHLIGKSWSEIAQTVWDKTTDEEGFSFKKSHSVAYAHLVVVNMNLLSEQSELDGVTS